MRYSQGTMNIEMLTRSQQDPNYPLCDMSRGDKLW
jgi:hypothetical protein